MEDSFCEKENKRLNKLSKFLIGHRFKKIGWWIFGIGLLLLALRKVFGFEELNTIRPFVKDVMIVALLLVSLSKDKIEDEMIEKLRAQSYRLAFIIGVFYYFTLPYISYGVDFLMGKEDFKIEHDSFTLILSMLFVQILFFTNLKRTH